MNLTEVIFDVETKSLFPETGDRDPAKLGVSVVSAYTRKLGANHQELEGRMESFWEKDFDKLWKLFQTSDRIIGFNTLHFDIPALQPYAYFNLAALPHFDLMDQVKHALGIRLSLNALASQTLGAKKSDSGVNAVSYWQKGDPRSLAKLKSYCEADVVLTRDLYDFGLCNNYLKYQNKWGQPKTLKIDFSYPQKASTTKQVGLF
jgi:DEAD/DEAH box helicase domain-containing protein